MKAVILVVFLLAATSNVAKSFLTSSNIKFHPSKSGAAAAGLRGVSMQIDESGMTSKKVIPKAMRLLSIFTLSTNLFISEPAISTAAATSTSAALEQSISKLEASETRADTVQSLADVFEAAGSRTLIARTKYKYVSYFSVIYY